MRAIIYAALLALASTECHAQVYETPPDNAEVILDRDNKTWISPPCLTVDNFERATRNKIDKFIDDEFAFSDREKWSARELITHGVLERSTMGDAHALRRKDPKWHPDDVCNNAGGFLDEKTVWGWLTNRPSRWTPDGQWRW
jgi:hypothetical protein